MSQERESELESVESILSKLSDKDFRQVWRILYGDGTYELEISEKCQKLADRYRIQLVSCGFQPIRQEQLRPPRMIRVGLFQQILPVPLSFPVRKVKIEMYTLATDAIKTAAKAGVKIMCLQQAWNMPYAFCKGERMPWNEYAERAEDGATTRILQALAEENKMVIISTILERDDIFEDRIWNTAIIIDNYGHYLGKHRRNHIPKVENSNEPTYYTEGNTEHPVFQTEFGRIAVNICYDRHYPLNWLGYALNGAQIVFNPCAAIGEQEDTMWAVEARNAAIANGFYVCSVNRVGMEIYEHDFECEDGTIIHHSDSGRFFGSSYVAAPNGSRSPGLSRTKNGLLICELDLNMCRQIKDDRGFGVTNRLDMYEKLLNNVSSSDFQRQLVTKS